MLLNRAGGILKAARHNGAHSHHRRRIGSTLLGGWGFDRQGPLCVFDREYTNCGYASYESCVEAARGAGGNCRPNPMYAGEREGRRQRYR